MPESAIPYVKFLRGTPVSYNNLATKDEDTLYFVSNPGDTTGKLYIGDKLIATNTSAGEGVAQYLSDLEDVSTADAQDKEVLAWDATTSLWKPMSITELVESAGNFTGATATEAGASGFVPAPAAGQQNYFLKGDGTWAAISGGSSVETLIFEVTAQAEQTNLEAINAAVGETELQKGDIAIVKREIGEDTNKFSHTAYVYNGTAWAAMDGNYNAEDVYFDKDFILTSSIGSVEIDETGHATLTAKGKSLKQVLDTLFTSEKQPEIVAQPEVKLTITGGGAYEVGTQVPDISYSAELEDGAYTYGPEPTGVTASSWSITTNDNDTLTTSTGVIPGIIVDDNTNLTISATCQYTEGSFAKTNTGKDTEIKIQAGSTTSETIPLVTGYRNTFYGAKNVNVGLETGTTLDSALIRGLTASGKTLEVGDAFEIEVPIGTKSVIIAVPASAGDEITSIVDTQDGSDLWMAGSFSVDSVSVNGANNSNATDYNVYYINFGFANDVANKYTVVI